MLGDRLGLVRLFITYIAVEPASDGDPVPANDPTANSVGTH